jgi:pimeloyl-ACP methyl ester carboxylesterase
MERVLASGMLFDCDVAGEPGAPLVLLLHGFPQTSHTWRHELPALAAAGRYAVAPNQRGYSLHARPHGIDAYRTDLLVRDVLNLADALGYECFDLVGHDWGGQIAWLVAAHHGARVRTLSVLSRPHPAAFAGAMKADPAQAERSKHHRAFHDPNTAAMLLADDAARLRRLLRDQGVPAADVDAYLSRLGSFEALDAALNWYRAGAASGSALLGPNVPVVRLPTLYLWGDRDATVGRPAAEATAQFVKAPYQFEVIPGGGHFLTDDSGARVTEAILAHLRRTFPGASIRRLVARAMPIQSRFFQIVAACEPHACDSKPRGPVRHVPHGPRGQQR